MQTVPLKYNILIKTFMKRKFLQSKTQQDATIYQQFLLFLILHEAQHVSGDTPPIIRSLKLHW